MLILLTLKVIFSFIVSFLLTFYFVPLCSLIAYKFNILDLPDGKIKLHKAPTPYLGGVAIYCGLVISLSLILPFESQLLLFILGSTILLLVGLIDDVMPIRPSQKLFGQFIATICFLKAGFHLKEMFFLNNYWNIPISALWIITVINAFNLVDVMDGLASLIAIHATIAFIFIAYLCGDYKIIMLLMAFLGALVAFFYYNRPKATIYLGDAGSLFIGGFLATIPFYLQWGIHSSSGFLAPLVILAIPLIEVLGLVVIRTSKGIPFYCGSPDHYSHYLKNKGWSQYGILAYSSLVSIVLCGIAISLVTDFLSLPFLLVLISAGLFLWIACLFPQKSRTT